MSPTGQDVLGSYPFTNTPETRPSVPYQDSNTDHPTATEPELGALAAVKEWLAMTAIDESNAQESASLPLSSSPSDSDSDQDGGVPLSLDLRYYEEAETSNHQVSGREPSQIYAAEAEADEPSHSQADEVDHLEHIVPLDGPTWLTQWSELREWWDIEGQAEEEEEEEDEEEPETVEIDVTEDDDDDDDEADEDRDDEADEADETKNVVEVTRAAPARRRPRASYTEPDLRRQAIANWRRIRNMLEDRTDLDTEEFF